MSERIFSPDGPLEPLFILNSVSVTHKGNGDEPEIKALDDINWTVRKNEHWAVLGHNGAGKSTLLRVVLGNQWPDKRTGITWFIDGKPETSPIAAKPHMAVVSPELQAEYLRKGWNITGEEALLTGFSGTSLLYGAPSEEEKHAMKLLARELSASLNIEPLLHTPVSAMSQGQLRRVLLARAMVAKPRFLVLDEFSDGLDAASGKDLHDILNRIAQTTTLIIAAHRVDDLPPCVTHALALRGGRIFASGPLREVLPVSILAHEHREEEKKALPAPSGAARRVPVSGEPVLELEHIDLFLDGVQVLTDINWTVREGEHWTVTGENGAGKTSLLRMLWGEDHHAWGGELRWFGKSGPFFMPDLRQRLGLVSDRLQAMYHPDLCGEDIVLSGFFGSVGLYDTPTEEMRETAEACMRRLGIAQYAMQQARHMSYGRLRRFLLCRSIVHSPKLLLLDEPCSGLDCDSRAAFLETLDSLAETGTQLVYITHRQQEQLRCITHTLRLHEGRVLYRGPVENA